jgi:hypothetical protein
MDPKTPEKLAQFAGETLSELEEAPFEWTSVAVEKRKIFVKIDKANPSIDALTEKWLSENDPDFQKRMEEEARATEKLFKTGGTPDSETKH